MGAQWGYSLLTGFFIRVCFLLSPPPSPLSLLLSPCHLARALAPSMPCVRADSLINSRLCRRLRGRAGHALAPVPTTPSPRSVCDCSIVVCPCASFQGEWGDITCGKVGLLVSGYPWVVFVLYIRIHGYEPCVFACVFHQLWVHCPSAVCVIMCVCLCVLPASQTPLSHLVFMGLQVYHALGTSLLRP